MFLKHTYLTELRPLAFLIKLLGWTPCSRANTNLGEVWILKFLSFDFFYSVIMITLQLAVPFRMLKFALKMMPSIPSHLRGICYYTLLYKIIPHVLPLLAAIQTPSQVHFIKTWLNVQHEIETIGISGTPYNFVESKRKLLFNVAIIWAWFFCGLTGRAIRLQRFTLEDVFLILGFINEALLFTWFTYTTHVFKILSDRLLHEYQLLLEYNEAGKSGELLAKVVLNLRSPSLKLSRIRNNSGGAISLSLGLLLIYSFTRILFVIYTIYTVNDASALLICGFVFLISVLELYSTCNASHEARKKWHEDLLKALTCTKMLRISNATKHTMTSFLLHLIQNNPEVSLGGYINVGRSLLSTLFSAFITCAVVIIQFKAYDQGNVTFEEFLFINDEFFTNITIY